MRIGSQPAARLSRARAAFVDYLGATAEAQRAREIATLPTKDWKGVPVYRLECLGGFGKGPHEIWVPEGVCWAVIALQHVSCPYHR